MKLTECMNTQDPLQQTLRGFCERRTEKQNEIHSVTVHTYTTVGSSDGLGAASLTARAAP